MTRDDIIKLAQDCGIPEFENNESQADNILRFAALVAEAERNKLAQWMMAKGYATGHGDTTEDLLDELDWQITESWSKVVMASVEAEREACAKVCEGFVHNFEDPSMIEHAAVACANAIRARGKE